MKKCILLIPFFLFLFLLVSGCAMTPARRPVAHGKTGIDFSLSAVLVDTPYTRIVPNFSLGIKYGLTDSLNIGVSMAPLLLFAEKNLLIEPYLLWRFSGQHGIAPSLTAYTVLPLILSFENFNVSAYPLIGVLPRYDFGSLGLYSAAEAFLDRERFEGTFLVKYNARFGMELELSRSVILGAEGGLNAIGIPSALYGWTIGQPVFRLGLLFIPGGAES